MPTRAKLFCYPVIVLGAVCFFFSVYPFTSRNPLAYLALVASATAAAGIRISLPTIRGTLSINFVFVLIGLITMSLPETMVGDAPRVRQLLSHFLANAIKFTHVGGVELRVMRDQKSEEILRVEVEDTGIGIPADQLDRIFESFRQVDSGLSRNYPGLGLGLALAKLKYARSRQPPR